ncbi:MULTISPECIES: hypothetical protein [unclassified Mesorhizobium]|uniref:hypothetical protein n=1 Tax=unclassified Mesorhizobium TaxID=325217 RepID=UPI003337AB2E
MTLSSSDSGSPPAERLGGLLQSASFHPQQTIALGISDLAEQAMEDRADKLGISCAEEVGSVYAAILGAIVHRDAAWLTDRGRAISRPAGVFSSASLCRGEAKTIFHLLDKAGLEGKVSKRKDSKYRRPTG